MHFNRRPPGTSTPTGGSSSPSGATARSPAEAGAQPRRNASGDGAHGAGVTGTSTSPLQTTADPLQNPPGSDAPLHPQSVEPGTPPGQLTGLLRAPASEPELSAHEAGGPGVPPASHEPAERPVASGLAVPVPRIQIPVPTFSFEEPSPVASPVTPESPARPVSEVPSRAADLARAWRDGTQTRRHYKVERVAPGIITSRVQGGPEHFERVGMPGLAHNGTAELHITAVDPHQYEAHVVGNHEVTTRRALADPATTAGLLGEAMPPEGSRVVLASGVYFNAGQTASRSEPAHVAIGEIASLTPDSHGHVALPDDYRDDYVKVDLGRTSMMAAPQLSEAGTSTFPAARLQEARYQFATHKNGPGKLSHASDPNPRGIVSFPAGVGRGANSLPGVAPDLRDTSRQDAVRFVAITSVIRGAEGTGATLPTTADVAARVDRMNLHPGYSANRDGGTSLYQSVRRVGGDLLQEVRSQGGSSTSQHGNHASFVAMVPKVEPDKAD